jgi:hypothetical protein
MAGFFFNQLMLSEIVRTKHNLNALLPLQWRQISPAAELMIAKCCTNLTT